ncbi:GyrI-like domain-containing protein [Sulfurimonas sp.]|uniref:GyrI-like domain-containing protein n=1 Tax=Sulfurimonas sp. TaxID=2022749 RepID=UPI003D0B5E12
MKKVKVESFNVAGLKVRTSNSAEMNPETGKIAKLWGDFCSVDIAQGNMESGEVYGVYFSYESDMNGEFDVLAGLKHDKDAMYENITIESGEYLVFRAKGKMPKVVIDTWMEVWNYFSKEGAEQRAYKTDFEKYVAMDEVEVYIGIK